MLSRYRSAQMVIKLLVIFPLFLNQGLFGPEQASLPANSRTIPAETENSAAALPPCQWGFYPGGKSYFVPLQKDNDATSPSRLRVGAYHRSRPDLAAANGLTDFNGDGISDLFRFQLRPDNLYQWQYSPGGTQPWVNLNYASTSFDQLRFGDFNGDAKTDIFTQMYDNQNSVYRWYVSYGGVSGYTPINSSPDGSASLQVVDFNNDGISDIFDTYESPPDSDNYRWRYSSGGSTPFVELAIAGVKPRDLRFGDFDGDGKSDVFAAYDQGNGYYQWVYSSAGASSWISLAYTTHSIGDVNFADFNGDGKTDVFALDNLPNGKANWLYWSGGLGNPILLHANAPAAMPYFGEFDGDNLADAFLAGCSEQVTYRDSFSGPLAINNPDYSYQLYTGYINYDTFKDIILISTCQGNLCDKADNIVTVAFSDGRGGISGFHQQVLDTSRAWEYFDHYVGDINGDGRSDLLFISPYDPKHSYHSSIYTAIWDGNKFVLSARMSLGDGFQFYNSYASDFTGDGLLDIVLTTVCMVGTGIGSYSCSVGNQNYTYIAVNQGNNFLLSSQQYFGAGWHSYYGYIGDVNGDRKTDLIFNSLCQKSSPTNFACDLGSANYIYTALSNGNGGLVLYPLQTYGNSGWNEYRAFTSDFNGDARTDMIWYRYCPGNIHCELSDFQVRAGRANSDGTFQVTSVLSFGISNWEIRTNQRGDVNGDGREDLIFLANDTNDRTTTSTLQFAFANENGSFTLQPEEQISYAYTDLNDFYYDKRVDDLTGDGREEIIVFGKQYLHILLNTSAAERVYLPVLQR